MRRQNFEKLVAQSAKRFDVILIFVVIVSGLLFRLFQLNIGLHSSVSSIGVPVGVSVAVRLVAVVCRRYTTLCPHRLSAFCFSVDALLILTCHPLVQPHVPWGERIVEFGDAKQIESEEQWLQFRKIAWEVQKCIQSEIIVVSYFIQILMWYVTINVLLFRHTRVVLPIIVLTYGAVLFVVEEADRQSTASKEDACRWETRGDPLCYSYKSFSGQSGLEVVLLATSTLVAVFAKASHEKLQRGYFVVLEEQKHVVVREKVLRWHAEVAQDQLVEEGVAGCLLETELVNAVAPYGSPFRLRSSSSSSSVEGRTPGSVAPPKSLRRPLRPISLASLRSAPAAPLDFLDAFTASSARTPGDCLPPQAAVWVEGKTMPLAVAEVTPGERVLCFDSLGRGCPKFVEVSGVRILEDDAQWVAVTLEDGASLTMTANHPVQRHRVEDKVGHAVRAEDLQAGLDRLMVMRMVPVAVERVESSPAPAGPEGKGPCRVALSLAQPERHEVFVAPPSSSGGFAGAPTTMAVGSADAPRCAAGAKSGGFVVRRTFLDLDTMVSGHGALRRGSSAPALRGGWSDFDSAEKPKTLAKAAPTRQGMRRAASASDVSSEYSEGTYLTGTSSRALSEASSQRRAVIIPATRPAGSAAGAGAAVPAFLSDVLGVRRRGLASVGGSDHAAGRCNPCIFQNRHHHGGAAACRMGQLCLKCHEPHDPLGKKKHKSGAMRRATRSKVDGGGPTSEQWAPGDAWADAVISPQPSERW